MVNERKGTKTGSCTRASLASYSSSRKLVIFNLFENNNENAYEFTHRVLRIVILSFDWNTWRTNEHLDIWVHNVRMRKNVICMVEIPSLADWTSSIVPEVASPDYKRLARTYARPWRLKYWDKALYCRPLVDESLVASLKGQCPPCRSGRD